MVFDCYSVRLLPIIFFFSIDICNLTMVCETVMSCVTSVLLMNLYCYPRNFGINIDDCLHNGKFNHSEGLDF